MRVRARTGISARTRLGVCSQRRGATCADEGARRSIVQEASRFGPGGVPSSVICRSIGSSSVLSHRRMLGDLRWTVRVSGGVAWTKWLTTLTGESPTSSRPAHAVERVTPADKALPKQLVNAAVRGRPSRTSSLLGWQLSRSNGDGRERETQRKEPPGQRTMRKVNPRRCGAHTSQPGPLSGSRRALRNVLQGASREETLANRTNEKTRKVG